MFKMYTAITLCTETNEEESKDESRGKTEKYHAIIEVHLQGSLPGQCLQKTEERPQRKEARVYERYTKANFLHHLNTLTASGIQYS